VCFLPEYLPPDAILAFMPKLEIKDGTQAEDDCRIRAFLRAV
jgi:hypothetical protein